MAKLIGAIVILMMFALFVGTAMFPPDAGGPDGVIARRAAAVREAEAELRFGDVHQK